MRDILSNRGVTWTNILDGSTHGALCTRWNIKGFPTFFLLDGKGALRAKDFRDVDQQVDKLLGEVASSPIQK